MPQLKDTVGQSQDPWMYYTWETHLTCKETHRLKIKEQKNIYQPNGKKEEKKAGVAILVSDKTDFKPTRIKKDKEGHYIMVKGSMQQEELTILNIYVPNTGASRLTKQVLRDLQRDLGSHKEQWKNLIPHCQQQVNETENLTRMFRTGTQLWTKQT